MISTREWQVIQWTMVVGTAMQLGWYLIWERFVPTEKQRAYVLCLLSSTIMTVGALPYFIHLLHSGLDGVLQQQQGDTAVALTTFFLTFLVWDLVVGVCRYRSKIDPLTGWVHHATYFCMLIWVLRRQYAPLFMALCVMELPTFFLSVGSIHTPWRHDYLFAATFVATRIVLHGSCLVGAVRTFGIFSSITLALAAVLPVHIYWFVGFIEQQKRLYRQKVAGQVIIADMPPRRSLEVEVKGTAVRRVCRSPIFPGSFVSHPAH